MDIATITSHGYTMDHTISLGGISQLSTTTDTSLTDTTTITTTGHTTTPTRSTTDLTTWAAGGELA